MKHQVGTRVWRHSNVYDRSSRKMRGVVTAVYCQQDRTLGRYHELYAILWDEKEKEDMGYLPHGFDPWPENRKEEMVRKCTVCFAM